MKLYNHFFLMRYHNAEVAVRENSGLFFVLMLKYTVLNFAHG